MRVHIGAGGPSVSEGVAHLSSLPEMEEVLKAEACAQHDLAPEMEGDVTVIARLGVALGARAAEHDLSGLAGERLCPMAGIAEQGSPLPGSRRRSIPSGAGASAPPQLRHLRRRAE